MTVSELLWNSVLKGIGKTTGTLLVFGIAYLGVTSNKLAITWFRKPESFSESRETQTEEETKYRKVFDFLG